MMKLNHCMVVHLVSQTLALSKQFFFVHLKINNQKCLTHVFCLLVQVSRQSGLQ